MTVCTDPSHLLDSISLTHVQFDPNDKIAYAFGYITLAPIAILVFYASVIVSRREMAGIFMLAGQLLNEAFNYTLKEAIEQERPHSHLGDGYGMPSSHAQFIWFFAAYGTLHLYKRIRLDHVCWKHLVCLAMYALAVLVSFSRIYLGYHTLNQVLAGSSVGILFGCVWYGITCYCYASGLVDYILELSIANKLYLRDMRSIDNVAKWEYEQWEKKRLGKRE